MDLFDMMAPEPVATEPPVPSFIPTRDQLVRHRDGRLGRVLLYVEATERAFIRFHGPQLPTFAHRLELAPEPKECRHKWVDGETLWEGDSEVRLTSTCGLCGEIKGRC